MPHDKSMFPGSCGTTEATTLLLGNVIPQQPYLCNQPGN